VVLGFTFFHPVQAEYIAILGVIVTQDKMSINVGGFEPSRVALRGGVGENEMGGPGIRPVRSAHGF
jgi:hypothetical protein